MRWIRGVMLGLGVALGTLLQAAPLAKPEGAVILTVTGAIDAFNEPDAARFDRAMLDRLPQHAMTTTTPWTEGPQRFEGPLLADLLRTLGASGQTLELRALNEYHAVIEWDEVAAYPLMLVMRVNGRAISVRERGPIWLLYPMSEFPELDSPYHHADMVWQLHRIEVQ